jgi:hypothetical protein
MQSVALSQLVAPHSKMRGSEIFNDCRHLHMQNSPFQANECIIERVQDDQTMIKDKANSNEVDTISKNKPASGCLLC